MLTGNLRTQTLPYLRLSDKVFQALELMNENHVEHLPIVEGDKYVGMISEEDLSQAENDHSTLEHFKQSISNPSVKDDEHVLKAIQVAVQNGLTVVPIVGEGNDMVGVVTYADLLKYSSEFMSLNEPGGLIVLEMESKDYSFNEISRIIESNDAQIKQLNTNVDPETGLMEVTIKLNKLEVSDIVASFQRHEYNVKYYFGEELFENELRTNYDNLMNYLKI
ncbi:MAG TPA: CBS domain-containing protein [Chitinophagaceae bacterium]|nr:CBS domain-containing protein [Chitinophagaceae bacterium]